jgi:prepilin-type N-terminal cleavage/methylation domain-containing protein
MPFQRAHGRAFTLIELLIAMTVLSLLVVLLASVTGGVNRAWVSAEQQVETFQDGRAILELISRELAQTVISPRLQFVSNPNVVDATGHAINRANSDSIFWQASLTPATSGSLCEVGYYLTDTYELKRFFVPPTDAMNYQIFAANPTDSSAPWVSNFVGNAALNTTVAKGVLAFWIRCFDLNGDPIPWLANDPAHLAATPLHFNSAAQFQSGIRGQTSSFKYTATSTAQAHLLPLAVEITLVTLDAKSLARSPGSVPPIPASADTSTVPDSIKSFNQRLITNNLKTARTFVTRVNIPVGIQ